MGVEIVDIDIIMRQTGITDKQQVRKAFYKNKKDVSATILELMNIEEETKIEKRTETEIEKMRQILDEKELIYQTRGK
jgi:ribosomal protein S13